MSAPIRPDLAADVDAIGLVDHHVHGTTRANLDGATFESMITESDRPIAAGTSQWDSQVGFAIRRWCAPVLDLDPHSSPAAYLDRRATLGWVEVNRRFLAGCRVAEWLIDTGFAADDVLSLDEMRTATDASCREIVRLEGVAERLVSSGVDAGEYTDAFAVALHDAVAAGAVGTKSIMAYRTGFDIDHSRPSAGAVAAAVSRWQEQIEKTGAVRCADPVLVAHGVWSALDLGRPLQFHVALGDTDLDLARSNPLQLTPLIRASESLATPIVLLHCYPYHREAGYLAQMFPHVYFDIGLAINYAGLQSDQLVAESLEVAPFTKQLFSSDGWGPAELHYLGALLWRRGIARAASRWVDADEWSVADARRVCELIGADNARRIYDLA
ncbi:MAG TPA: amidohydrolase family protein [Mycobacteriales bacterium]|nr:amidohydrolase family protein [Mycobacteriales bacterium]